MKFRGCELCDGSQTLALVRFVVTSIETHSGFSALLFPIPRRRVLLSTLHVGVEPRPGALRPVQSQKPLHVLDRVEPFAALVWFAGAAAREKVVFVVSTAVFPRFEVVNGKICPPKGLI